MNSNIETFMNCPACGKKYARGSSRVVERRGGYALLHVKCPLCFASSMAFVGKKGQQGNFFSINSLTDLSFQEASLMTKQKPLTVDEVIDICSALGDRKEAGKIQGNNLT